MKPPHVPGTHAFGFDFGSDGSRASFGWQLIQLLFARAQASLASFPVSTRKLDGGRGKESGMGWSDIQRKRLFEESISFDQLAAQN